MRKLSLIFTMTVLSSSIFASNIIPIGSDNNNLYYTIGGGSDFALPPVSESSRITLDTETNLGFGNICTAFNPAISIRNSMNNIKDSADNLTKDIFTNLTASVMQLPAYAFARINPSAYALVKDHLLSAHKEMELSTSSCQTVHDRISKGENPYQDWGTISINDQWKKKLSLTYSDQEDINHAKKEIDKHAGDDGVTWVTGNRQDGSTRSGGKGQPPIRVVADTVKAGYNTMLNRGIQSDSDAPKSGASAELARQFSNPAAAVNWITNVVGDQMITTCNDATCKSKQGSVVGHGLLPWITACQINDGCIDHIRDHLADLITGHESITKDNLDRVSADGIAMSPDVIAAMRNMDTTQQKIIINKLAQEIAVQRVIDKALVARNILTIGAQVPVIAANRLAQLAIARAITHLDNDIRSVAFEKQMRKEMVSDTLLQVLNFSSQQRKNAMNISPVTSPKSIMEQSAVREGTK